MEKRLLFKKYVKYLSYVLILQLLIVFTYSSASLTKAGNIQDDKINIDVKNANLSDVLSLIEKQTGSTFLYQSQLISKHKVTIHAVDKSLKQVLDSILEPLDIAYEIDKTHIILSRKIKQQAALKISGQVTDEADGTPLPGVNIIVKGTTTGTSTDANGEYSLQLKEENSVLVLSFIGYLTQEVPVNGRSVINVPLKADIQSLEEVVVVGYGEQKKITSVGSQSSIKVADLQQQPVANLSNAITGRIAGIVGVQRSGEPGYDNSQIFIRGISSFAQSASNPLILVDGVERSFNNIDPEDIESFSILKDASATAIYGVRGGNGVILINTKKGSNSKPKLNFQYNQGITQFTKLPQFVDGVEYMRVANEARHNTNPNMPPYYSEETIQATIDQSDPDLYPNVDWFDEILDDRGQNRRINFNVDGGSDKATYYLSVGYYDEKGLFKSEELDQYTSSIGFTRYNFTSNLTLDLTNSTKVNFGASGYISDGNYPGVSSGAIFASAYTLPPVVHPPKYSDGKIAQQRTGDINNPYNLLTQSGYVAETKSQIWSNIRVTQDLSHFVDGLSATAMFSFDNNNTHQISRTKSVDRWLAVGRDSEGNLIYEGDAPVVVGTNVLGYARSNGGQRQKYFEASLNYNHAFGKHEVGGLILYNQTDRVDAFAGDFTTSIPYRFHGIAGRGTYAYDERYLLEANFGYNGSEAFAPENRYGFFPSVGIGWVASNEKFFGALDKYIQFLKIRLSHGVVGNAALTASGQRFAYLSTVNGTGADYVFGRNQDNRFGGLDIEYYAANVQWETSTKSNLGVELNTLNGDLALTVDFFRDIRSDIYLLRGDVPDYAGVRNQPTGNLGEVFNKGVDGTLTYNKHLGRSFDVSFRGNFTWNRATVVNDANAEWPYPWQQRIGRKLGQRFGYIALGLFESEEEIANSPRQTGTVKPGDIKFKDLNADGVIDSYDQAPIGYGAFPEIAYGFGTSIAYKGFAIGAFFKGISNVDIMLNGEGIIPFQQGVGTRGNLLANIDNRWTEEDPNPNAFYPRLSDGVNNMNYDGSTWWVRNGGYLRLQNVEVSYTFPQSEWFDKIGLDNLRLYCIGYNLVTFSKFKLWDVELGDGRGASYPLIKTISFGIDCRF
ncbi:TonB-dependent receptor [Fulvivirga ligni]|uniref:TonB-dependent receptor n=1 Tax=Fulvivirga ligni TaxID=2904246 RepID=UPI001F408CE1|nr:TonB-dependent receptor [Fulvivirga ligni]UII19624.1 TonB-dependent receptor [Fulvivirga ligni]